MQTYTNPILPGMYPDPSICRAGDDYWLVTSSMTWLPAVPVFHSRDLVHWRQVGHAVSRPSQWDAEHWETSAPTIRWHDGLFYIVITGRAGMFILTAKDPAGEWSDPIVIGQPDGQRHICDPSPLFDDDGKVFLSWATPVDIAQAQVDMNTGKVLSDVRHVWTGTGGRWPEAPHLFKLDGWYYFTMAEGGTEYGHMQTISRSRSPWGPFDPCRHNPILTHRNRLTANHTIQGCGHADLVQDQFGRWWGVFLAFRTHGGFFHHLGRETFLSPVTWQDGWPTFGKNGTVDLQMQAECLPAHVWPVPPTRDDFDKPKLGLCWNFRRPPREGDWSLTQRAGFLRLRGMGTLDDRAFGAFVARRQEHFECMATTRVEFTPTRDGDEAGLTAYMDPRHHYELAVAQLEGKRHVIVRRRIGDLVAIVAREDAAPGPVDLQLSATAGEYTFGYSVAGGPTRKLATGATRYLSTEVAGGFTGVYLAMYASGETPADFDWFDYEAKHG